MGFTDWDDTRRHRLRKSSTQLLWANKSVNAYDETRCLSSKYDRRPQGGRSGSNSGQQTDSHQNQTKDCHDDPCWDRPCGPAEHGDPCPKTGRQ